MNYNVGSGNQIGAKITTTADPDNHLFMVEVFSLMTSVFFRGVHIPLLCFVQILGV